MMVETKSKGPSVVLSHGGVQYSYQIAFGLQEAGFLNAFWTTFYSLNGRNKFPLFHRFMNRRHHEGLDPKRIHSNPWPEAFQRTASLLLGKNYFTVCNTTHWGNRLFDHSVSRQLKKTNYDIFIGLSGSSLRSLEEAKIQGKVAIVDQHDIHYALAASLLEEERRLHPEFASSLPYWPPLKSYLDCVQKEFEVADFIMVPSSFSLRTHLEAGIPKQKLILLLHGLNECPVNSLPPRSREEEFQILFVGTITQRKGIKYLLEAVKQLHLSKIKLTLIGDLMVDKKTLAPYEEYFRYVPYLPHRDLQTYFREAHILILPSVYDAFGLVVLEAMAAGIPVIVSENTAAGSDIVRNGTDGFVVPIRDAEAIKDRINRLYEDPSLRKEMGRNASERVKEFSWQAYRTRLKKTLENIYAA